MDAFTGQKLDWTDRSLSLLSTAGIIFPFLSEIAAESRTASVVQAVEAAEGISNIRGGATPVRAGQVGEAAIRAAEDIGPKGSFQINGRTRIADGLLPGVLSEVKNVKSQSLTQQIRDYIDFANQKSSRVDLYVRSSTYLTKPLMDARDAGAVHIIPHSF